MHGRQGHLFVHVKDQLYVQSKKDKIDFQRVK